MISVKFKEQYSDSWSVKEYFYEDYEGVEIGDIVLVDTINGIALAKVSQISLFNDTDFKLRKVIKIIITQKEENEKREEELKRQARLKEIKDEIKRAEFNKRLESLGLTDLVKEIKDFPLEELIN